MHAGEPREFRLEVSHRAQAGIVRVEKTEGSLEAGKLADLIVLARDLFKIEPNEIAKTEVLLTMVGGKVVYQSSAWSATSAAASEAK